MSDIVNFPKQDRRTHCQHFAKQRRELLRAFDAIESPDLREKAVSTCKLLGISERNNVKGENDWEQC